MCCFFGKCISPVSYPIFQKSIGCLDRRKGEIDVESKETFHFIKIDVCIIMDEL